MVGAFSIGNPFDDGFRLLLWEFPGEACKQFTVVVECIFDMWNERSVELGL
jgi:hypothetical protein